MASKNPVDDDADSLGIEAYADSTVSNADLLKNLEGQPVHRFSEGTEEHAGTALMVIELPDGNGLGMQVEMENDAPYVNVYPAPQEDTSGWTVDADTERKHIDELEEPCPDCEIVEIVERNLTPVQAGDLPPSQAELYVILDPNDGNQYALSFHVLEDGAVNYFGVDL
jgi:hypothetical protein